MKKKRSNNEMQQLTEEQLNEFTNELSRFTALAMRTARIYGVKNTLKVTRRVNDIYENWFDSMEAKRQREEAEAE